MKKFVITLFWVATTLFLIRSYGYQFYKIPAGSMQPALLVGDVIAANKWLYLFEEPQRGDLVLFNYPKDESQVFVKRLIGLPGESLGIKKQIVYINGLPIKEPYAFHDASPSKGITPSLGNDFGPLIIPDKYYFVLGDNREKSQDSRHFGLVKRDKIFGKADRVINSKDEEGENRPRRFWKAFPAITFH